MLAAPSLAAQGIETKGAGRPLHALAVDDLDFGTIFPGVPASVSPSDTRRSGLFEVRGRKGSGVRVEFVLPAALDADGGARLPLSFGTRDGLADFSGSWDGPGQSFDPRAPVLGSLGRNGRLFLRLGGTALPSRTQRAGAYRATLFLTVYDLGT